MRASLWLLALLLAAPAHADELEQTQAALEKSNAKQEQLAKQAKKIETELEDLQKKLVVSADAIRENETQLADAEEKLHILDAQLKPRQEKFAGNQKHLAMLIQLSLRLSRMPPEAMVMMPGDVATSMKAATALKMTTGSIKSELTAVNLEIQEIKKLQDKIAERRDAITERKKTLADEQKQLEESLKDRRALQAKIKTEQDEEAEKAEALARKEEDLQGVFSSLRSSEKQGKAATYPSAKGEKGSLRSFLSAKGHLRLPAVGTLAKSFGVQAGGGETTKGITVATRKNARVLAPYDGEVVFTGPFLSYGKMVILHHSDDFHTLLAGLSRIDVKAGEFLLEGEPIGAMGDEPDNRLYVEFRKDNQPVDPLPWMKKEER